MTRPKIGLALGSGGARGWSHIGVIRALEERGIYADVVAGTSMGALVGAAYVGGQLDVLEGWARSITARRLATMIDVNLTSGGLVEAKQVVKFFNRLDMPTLIEDQKIPYMAIATDMRTGREVWLQKGPIVEAMRASISLPGIISPVHHNDRWLLDGGLTNPLPVSACRAMGADVIIAVNPEAKKYSVMWQPPKPVVNESWEAVKSALSLPMRSAFNMFNNGTDPDRKPPKRPPNYFDVVSTSIDVMVDQVRRSRLIADPPHVLLEVNLANMTVLDLNRAAEAIEAGVATVEREAAQIEAMLG